LPFSLLRAEPLGMTGEEMERAIEFLLQNQATLEERVEQTQAQLAELTNVVRMQADSQGQFNQTVTTAITALAEAQGKTEAKVDRLADIVGKLVERLAGGQG
jgi:ABC-type transporter Mla subunit MlaD